MPHKTIWSFYQTSRSWISSNSMQNTIKQQWAIKFSAQYVHDMEIYAPKVWSKSTLALSCLSIVFNWWLKHYTGSGSRITVDDDNNQNAYSELSPIVPSVFKKEDCPINVKLTVRSQPRIWNPNNCHWSRGRSYEPLDPWPRWWIRLLVFFSD